MIISVIIIKSIIIINSNTTMLGYLSTHQKDLPNFIPDNFSHPVKIIPETTLSEIPPQSLQALLVGFTIDQRLFAGFTDWIRAFLQSGGTLVFNGHIAYPFLPELTTYQPLPKRGKKDLLISRVTPHAIFSGIDFMDLSERRGVRGFYGRGANPMPKQATAINRVGNSNADAFVDWQWDFPGGGRLFVHAGINLWLYSHDQNTASRLIPQLLAWCMKEDYHE